VIDGLRVADNAERSRYELLDGEQVVGWVDYRPAGRSLIIAHTEVAGGEGRGLGSALVRELLEQLRADGRTAIPLCPFTAAFIDRHREYLDVVDPSFRGRFGGA
jgi:predicted GNAT family acetyltransferase